MAVSVKLEGFNTQKTLNRIINNDRVGLYMANTVAKQMDRYVPADTMTLANTRITRPWEIEFIQPYASYVYENDYLNFSKDKHPLAQAHWDRPTQKNQANKIAKEMTEYIKKS